MIGLAGKKRFGMRAVIFAVLVTGLAFFVFGCGTKGDPIPKNPFVTVWQGHETHSIL
jgi:hypothetical protein